MPAEGDGLCILHDAELQPAFARLNEQAQIFIARHNLQPGSTERKVLLKLHAQPGVSDFSPYACGVFRKQFYAQGPAPKTPPYVNSPSRPAKRHQQSELCRASPLMEAEEQQHAEPRPSQPAARPLPSSPPAPSSSAPSHPAARRLPKEPTRSAGCVLCASIVGNHALSQYPGLCEECAQSMTARDLDYFAATVSCEQRLSQRSSSQISLETQSTEVDDQSEAGLDREQPAAELSDFEEGGSSSSSSSRSSGRRKAAEARLPQTTALEVKLSYYQHFAAASQQDGPPIRSADEIRDALEDDRVQYTVKIMWVTDKDENGREMERMKVIRRPPVVNMKSRRLFKRFGSDRVLFVQCSGDHRRAVQMQDFFNELRLHGRRFRFLAPRRKSAWRSSSADGDGTMVEAVFFAVEGDGLEPCSAAAVRHWHLPLELAIDGKMTLPKYAQRFKLALSDTTQTLELQPHEISVMDDSDRGMFDGCGLISADLMDAIADFLGFPGRIITALQVRIGPAKGMLVRTTWQHRQVILSSKQLKYGTASYFQDCEPCQRIIEVCEEMAFADERPRKPCCSLNHQVILVLQSLGVSAQVFLDLEKDLRRRLAVALSQGFDRFQAELDLLPGVNQAEGIVNKIWSMAAAGIDPLNCPAMFLLLERFLAARFEDFCNDRGHLPCPETYNMLMVPDFSRRLKPGTMSVWIPGHGFLKGKYLVTRIPCASPSDIVELEAVEDLRFKPEFDYHNVAVMSAHDSELFPIARRMSGGDYDGDRVFIIGYKPIVEAARVLNTVPAADDEKGPGPGKFLAPDLKDILAHTNWSKKMSASMPVDLEDEEEAGQLVSDFLRWQCVAMMDTAELVPRINYIWTQSADYDISTRGVFSQATLDMAALWELALDSDKSGWTICKATVHLLGQKWPRPSWYRFRVQSFFIERSDLNRSSTGNNFTSRSALGKLSSLQGDVPAAIQAALQPIRPEGPKYQGCEVLWQEASRCVQNMSEAEKASHKRTLERVGEARETYLQERRWSEADKLGRETWQHLVTEAEYCKDSFVLWLYHEEYGDTRCWDLCLQELCFMYATLVEPQRTITVQRGKHFGLTFGEGQHPSKRRRCWEAECIDYVGRRCDVPALRNLEALARMLSPADGGDLKQVKRHGPMKISVRRVRYTHAAISGCFKDGKALSKTCEDLRQGKIDPLDADFLRLDCVILDGLVWSLRNRRLHVLKKYQESEERDVMVHVDILDICNPVVLHKFMQAWSTQNWGEDVLVESREERRAHRRRTI
mmetsp:Transcript_70826/g.169571  ORF Transcript_70826/g.169571 Transcript_70826/m.169571 type:complete len:1269 (-) Transcript_70826:80-3886(-)